MEYHLQGWAVSFVCYLSDCELQVTASYCKLLQFLSVLQFKILLGSTARFHNFSLLLEGFYSEVLLDFITSSCCLKVAS